MAVDKMTHTSGRELCEILAKEIDGLNNLDNRKIQGLLIYRALMSRKVKFNRTDYDHLLAIASSRNILDYLLRVSGADDAIFAAENKISVEMRHAVKRAVKDSE